MKRLFSILGVIMLLLTSCGGGGRDALLSTIPSDTRFCVVIDLNRMSSKLDEQAKATLKDFVDKAAANGKRGADLFGDDSQVDFSVPMILFEYHNSTLLTFRIKNEDKFRKSVEENDGVSFSNTGAILASDDDKIFIDGKQVWISLAYPNPEAADIAVLSQLKKDDSVLGLECASQLGSDDDISGLVNIDKSLQDSWNRSYRMALNMAFDDPAFLVWHTDFKKDKMESEITVVNYKGKPAPFALKTSKINTDKLSKFTGRGNLFGAISLDSDLVRNLIKQIRGFTSLAPDQEEMLMSLDGNVAFSAYLNDVNSSPEYLTLMLTFKNKDAARKAADLMTDNFGNPEDMKIFTDDNRLYMMTAAQKGEQISSVISDFKNANIAIAITPEFGTAFNGSANQNFDGASLRLTDNGDGVKILIDLKSKGDSNSLSSLIKTLLGNL